MGYQIELRHLHYFKTLAEELHFRKAAERLFIAQPGLSRQIKQLEVYYGTSLFFRNKRRVELTSAGQYLYREVKHVFEQLDRIEAKMEKMAAGKSITLKVGFIGSAIQAILPELLIDLNHLHPSIDLSLNELSTSVQLELLKQFEQDVGFVRMEDIPTGLDSIPILRETFSLVVPKNRYTNLSSDNIQLIDFRDTPFILFAKEYSSSYYDLVMSIFRDHAFKPIVALKTVNALSIFSLVGQGLGVAIVPSSLQKGYHTHVDFLELSEIPQRTTLSLLWNPRNTNPGVLLFLNVLRSHLNE